MSYDYISEVLEDWAIETPLTSILVRFRHKACRLPGFDCVFPEREILVEVLSETENGALAIARRHHGNSGSAFEVERRPWHRNMAREVVFDDIHCN